MARDRQPAAGGWPPCTRASHVPHRAEVAVGLRSRVLVATVDLRGAIGFSSFAVLTYYAIANASALDPARPAGGKLLPVVGLAGCVLLASTCP